MSWGVKTTYFKAPGMSLGGSGVSIGGVRSLRDIYILTYDLKLGVIHGYNQPMGVQGEINGPL